MGVTRIRPIAALSLAAGAALILAGCSGGGGDEGPADAAPTEASGSMTLWVGSWWADQIPTIVSAFEADHPDISLSIEAVPIDGYQDKITSSTLGGNPPDLVDLDVNWLSTYAGQELLEPVDDVAATLDPDAYAPGPWEASQYDGIHYAIPDRSSATALFYNAALFRDAGLPVPTDEWDWNALVTAAEALTAPDKKQYGFGLAADLSDPQNAMDTLAISIWSHGGDLLSEDNSTAVVNSPEAVEGLAAWAGLFTDEKVAPPGTPNFATTRDIVPLFQAGQLAMFIGGSNNIDKLNDTAGLEWGTVLVPGRTNISGGYTMAIPVGAKNPDAAKVFLQWLAVPETQAKMVVRTPAVLESLSMPPWNGPDFTTFNEATKYARPLPPVSSWTQIQNIIITNAQKVLVGQSSPQDAADDMASQIDAQLAKNDG